MNSRAHQVDSPYESRGLNKCSSVDHIPFDICYCSMLMGRTPSNLSILQYDKKTHHNALYFVFSVNFHYTTKYVQHNNPLR